MYIKSAIFVIQKECWPSPRCIWQTTVKQTTKLNKKNNIPVEEHRKRIQETVLAPASFYLRPTVHDMVHHVKTQVK